MRLGLLYLKFAVFGLLLAGVAQASNLDEIYLKAVNDARMVEHGEISRKLLGISSPQERNNPKILSWKIISGKQHVLVCTWAGKYLQGKGWQVGKEYSLAKTDNLWVTAVPELKDFFLQRGFWPSSHDGLVLRIKQLLGLPASDRMTVLIEFWVRPADLFRPSPDSDPSDHEAQLDYPWKRSPFQSFDPSMKIHSYVDAANPDVVYNYKQWFENLNATIYSDDTPYPWTQLGYTYDWADDKFNNNHVGLSEFIVLGGSNIIIEKMVNTEDLGEYFVKPLSVESVR
ncbi:hypothetical protein [Desulfovibrio sp. JC022]|uniref:hypothetical protein n=1 Tax=Desulfovibrio sp. JC022 TaxID=2593642 RepID=UPI0013CF73E4|nr:hypothetical protein [Desulfovibrio sp. JC022]NDV22926.1 hypothetical protein [Desulfovibrio sp. JC022]